MGWTGPPDPVQQVAAALSVAHWALWGCTFFDSQMRTGKIWGRPLPHQPTVNRRFSGLLAWGQPGVGSSGQHPQPRPDPQGGVRSAQDPGGIKKGAARTGDEEEASTHDTEASSLTVPTVFFGCVCHRH